MASLNGVDSNGVSQEVIDRVGQFREWHHEDPIDDPTDDSERHIMLTFDMAVSQRDAEYIVECLRILLHEERIRTVLSLDRGGISDEAIDVFGRFLRETQCHLGILVLYQLPSQQFRRLLEALHTNTSVKDLCICGLRQDEGASWIADLLRHKTNFTQFQLYNCCFPLMQILPLLRGQPNLQLLSFDGCRISSDILLFNDPDSTQLFVNTILLSPYTTLKTLYLPSCGVSLENRPLMAGFHNNTTIVELTSDHEDDATQLFIEPILRRNLYLGHVHDMLGTRMTTMLPSSSTLPAGAVGEQIVVPTTIPPPCGLWAIILGKVGQGTQGASPVFTILRDRLATWMEPSPRYENQNELEQQDADYQHASPLQPETASPTNHADSAEGLYATRLDDGELVIAPLLVQNMDDSVTSPVAASTDWSERFQSGVCYSSSRVVTVASAATTTTKSLTPVDPTSSSATVTEAQQSLLHKKRAAVSTTDKSMVRSKKPKPDML